MADGPYPSVGSERWDLTAEEHVERAAELLREVPRAGDVLIYEQQRQAIAGRHLLLAEIARLRRLIEAGG